MNEYKEKIKTVSASQWHKIGILKSATFEKDGVIYPKESDFLYYLGVRPYKELIVRCQESNCNFSMYLHGELGDGSVICPTSWIIEEEGNIRILKDEDFKKTYELVKES